MKITFWKGVFVADSLPGDKTSLERAGFQQHEPTMCSDRARCKACRAKIGRRYWSPRIEDATRLRSHCTDIALKVMKEHLSRLEKSRAVDANIDVPAPPGLEYLPYQKAGISYAIQRKDTLIGDEMGLGKDQPLDAKILTLSGWIRMRDLRLGDDVLGSDGCPYPVTGIFPQGMKKVFRVTFQDGSSTECGEQHLWEVNTPLRKWQRYKPRVKPLSEIKRRITNNQGNRLHFIRLIKPPSFKKHLKHFIDPYVMGYLLGNGGLSQQFVRITIPDLESVTRLERLISPGYRLSKQSPIDYIITPKNKKNRGDPNPFLNEMRRLKLIGHRTEEKFIPPEYM